MPINIYDGGEIVGLETPNDGIIALTDTVGGRQLAKWVTEGVPGLRGTINGDIIRDEPVIISPVDHLFILALLDHFERIGWTVKNEPLVNVFCPTGPGGGVDATCSPSGSSGGHLADGKGLGKHISDNAGGVKFTDLQLQKIAHINPDGVTSGKVKVPKALNDQQMAKLKAILPPGTIVQKVNASSKQIGLDKAIATAFEEDTSGGKGLDTSSTPSSTPTAPGVAGTPPSTGKYEAKFKPIPEFLDKATAPANEKAAKEMLELAKVGAIKELEAHPGTPSPKLKDYHEHLVDELKMELGLKKPGEAPKEIDLSSDSFGGKAVDGLEKATSVIGAQSKAHIATLNGAQKEDIRSYTGSGYYSLNKAMRQCPPEFDCVKGSTKTTMNNIVSAIDSAPAFKQPVVVRRGMSIDNPSAFISAVQAAKDSDTPFQFPSVTSTSIAGGFSGNVRFKVSASHGLHVKSLSNYKGEEEVLLSPKAQFKIVNIETGKEKYGSGKMHVIHLEEIQ